MIDSDNWSPWLESGDLTHVPTYTTTSELRALGAATGKVDCYTGVADGRVHAAANDNYPRLVALTGSAGSGKSTATKFLVERHGYTLVKFAGPLKDACRALGLTDRHIEGDLKEESCEMLCGKTPRYLMQAMGTELGRNLIGENLWVNLWRSRALDIMAHSFGRVVVDDCRFPNEAEAIRQLGGMIIKLEGRGGIAGQHASEAGCGQHDAVVMNDGGVVDLYASVEQEVRKWAA